MFRKIFIGIVVLMMIACNPKVSDNIAKDIQTQSIQSTTKKYDSKNGLVGYCDSLNIPNDLELWERTVFKGYESNKIVEEYFYIRYDDTSDVFRVKISVEGNDTSIVVTHRIMR